MLRAYGDFRFKEDHPAERATDRHWKGLEFKQGVLDYCHITPRIWPWKPARD